MQHLLHIVTLICILYNSKNNETIQMIQFFANFIQSNKNLTFYWLWKTVLNANIQLRKNFNYNSIISSCVLRYIHKLSKQCTATANKANEILGLINRTFTFKNETNMIQLYKSRVRLHIQYATQEWA